MIDLSRFAILVAALTTTCGGCNPPFTETKTPRVVATFFTKDGSLVVGARTENPIEIRKRLWDGSSVRTIFPGTTTAFREQIDGHEFVGLVLAGTEQVKDEYVDVIGRFDENTGGYFVRVKTTLPSLIVGKFGEGHGDDEDPRLGVQKEIEPGTHEFTLMPPTTP